MTFLCKIPSQEHPVPVLKKLSWDARKYSDGRRANDGNDTRRNERRERGGLKRDFGAIRTRKVRCPEVRHDLLLVYHYTENGSCAPMEIMVEDNGVNGAGWTWPEYIGNLSVIY